MDLLFNQENKFYNSTLADLETYYHLLTSIYYKNSLNLTMSLVTKYYNLLLWTGHNYEYKYQNVFLKYEMTFVVCIA
jgi:translation initiation factor 2 beta subunit (eIF-2beta)/eIF-5